MEVVMVHLKVILTVFLIRLRNTTKIVGHNNHFQACYKPETPVISYRILILTKLFAGRQTKKIVHYTREIDSSA